MISRAAYIDIFGGASYGVQKTKIVRRPIVFWTLRFPIEGTFGILSCIFGDHKWTADLDVMCFKYAQ